ncbi:hypothetical protein [Nocardia carnea]|uniref:hypothetical protein n=1 Tax=Nocardia carnea TaxID=37328 RepID=UPI002455679D|nr:hypothetical protein [Nocardia carnea]
MAYLRSLTDRVDALEVLNPGEFDGYADFTTYGVRPGRTLEPADVSMNRLERIDEVVAAYQSLQRDRPELQGVKLQIGQPHPLDLAMFVFAGGAVASGLPVGLALRRSNLVVAALRQLPVFTAAALDEMREVRRRYGDLVLWQVESPVSLLATVKAQQLGLLWALAPTVARQMADFLGRAREIDREHGIDDGIALHLCYGDYQHQSLLSPRNLAPAVTLLNRTGRLLKKDGGAAPMVHIPCAYGGHAAPVDPKFYAPLTRLDSEWKVIAGVASPDRDASALALDLFEGAVGRTAHGVAAACGFGRHSAEDAARAATAIADIADRDQSASA